MNLIPDTGINYMFIDMNSFFASCEQQDFPDLRAEPVIVVPFDSDYTCAIAASIEAKAFGIKTGTKVYEAKQLCPRVRVVPARHQAYVEYHHKIIAELVKHTPIRKIWSVDECDSRLMERHRSRAGAIALGRQIKQGLRTHVGDYIRASIGFAPNSFLAKTATELQKPDGLVVIEGRDLPHALDDLDLRDLCGIGANIERRLQRAGIHTVRQLWACDPKRARAIWGNVAGERFWYNLHGVAVPETETSRSCIGHSRVLDPELRTPEAAFQVMRRLTTKAVQRLRREGFLTRYVSLYARGVLREHWGRSLKIPQTDDMREIVHHLESLWRGGAARCITGRFKQVNVLLSGLIDKKHATGDLFAHYTPTPHQRRQQRLNGTPIEEVMDHINRKFGAQTINLGVAPALNGAPIGTKIAFTRVPDAHEFME